MSDLVERLISKSTDGHVSDEALYREAADRIEALEAALRNINDICHPDHEAACMAAIAIARAALAPEQDK